MTYQLNIKASIWNKDANSLFDYESENYIFSNLTVNKNSKIIKSGKTIKVSTNTKNTNNNNAESDFVVNILKEGLDNYMIQLDNDNSNNLSSSSRDAKPWIIIRNGFSSKGYRIRNGDYLKFGKVILFVKDIYKKESNANNNKNKDKNSCIKNLPNTNIPQQQVADKSNIDLSDLNFLDKNNKTILENHNNNTNNNPTNKKKVKHINSCRVCLSDDNEEDDPLISPCKCIGSVKHVHLNCLKKWLASKLTTKTFNFLTVHSFKVLECELCKESLPEKVKYKNTYYNFLEISKPETNYIMLESKSKEPRETRYVYIIQLIKGQTVKLGRSNDSDVRMTDISISRSHAFLNLDNESDFYLTDNNSKFGTLFKMREDILVLPVMNLSIQYGKLYLTYSLNKSMLSMLCCKSKQKLLQYKNYNDYLSQQSSNDDNTNVEILNDMNSEYTFVETRRNDTEKANNNPNNSPNNYAKSMKSLKSIKSIKSINVSKSKIEVLEESPIKIEEEYNGVIIAGNMNDNNMIDNYATNNNVNVNFNMNNNLNNLDNNEPPTSSRINLINSSNNNNTIKEVKQEDQITTRREVIELNSINNNNINSIKIPEEKHFFRKHNNTISNQFNPNDNDIVQDIPLKSQGDELFCNDNNNNNEPEQGNLEQEPQHNNKGLNEAFSEHIEDYQFNKDLISVKYNKNDINSNRITKKMDKKFEKDKRKLSRYQNYINNIIKDDSLSNIYVEEVENIKEEAFEIFENLNIPESGSKSKLENVNNIHGLEHNREHNEFLQSRNLLNQDFKEKNEVKEVKEAKDIALSINNFQSNKSDTVIDEDFNIQVNISPFQSISTSPEKFSANNKESSNKQINKVKEDEFFNMALNFNTESSKISHKVNNEDCEGIIIPIRRVYKHNFNESQLFEIQVNGEDTLKSSNIIHNINNIHNEENNENNITHMSNFNTNQIANTHNQENNNNINTNLNTIQTNEYQTNKTNQIQFANLSKSKDIEIPEDNKNNNSNKNSKNLNSLQINFSNNKANNNYTINTNNNSGIINDSIIKEENKNEQTINSNMMYENNTKNNNVLIANPVNPGKTVTQGNHNSNSSKSNNSNIPPNISNNNTLMQVNDDFLIHNNIKVEESSIINNTLVMNDNNNLMINSSNNEIEGNKENNEVIMSQNTSLFNVEDSNIIDE